MSSGAGVEVDVKREASEAEKAKGTEAASEATGDDGTIRGTDAASANAIFRLSSHSLA